MNAATIERLCELALIAALFLVVALPLMILRKLIELARDDGGGGASPFNIR